MITATRNWFSRNRNRFAVGAGVVGATYLAGQYVIGKIGEARQRMSEDRISRENLRRRFEQNQQDCTFTVLAILPTATENILEALPAENILAELQQEKSERLARSVAASETAPSDIQSVDIQSTAPSVTEGDDKSLPSESFVHASQVTTKSEGNEESKETKPQAPEQPSPPVQPAKKSKALLWNDLKIMSITRAFTLIYTLSLLTLLTRIQLNLLGRRNYLASVVSLAAPPKQDPSISLENHDDDNLENAYGTDFETNRRYLSFSWWLLHRGCKDIMTKVRAAVTEVFGPVNLREMVTPERLAELIMEVRKRVEGRDTEERRNHKWLSYLLPPTDLEAFVLQESGMEPSNSLDSQFSSDPSVNAIGPSLRRLIDETSDFVDSPPFAHVLTLALDACFSLLVDTKLSALAFKIPPISTSAQRAMEIVGNHDDIRVRLASCLPIFTKQAHVIGSGTGVGAGPAGNDYLVAVDNVRDLEALAAVVYSSNFEFEAVDAQNAADAGQQKEGLGGDTVLVTAQSGFEEAWGRAMGEGRADVERA